MEVGIFEIATQRLVCSSTVYAGGPIEGADSEYFAQVWREAVEDGLVDGDNRAAYEMQFLDI